MRTAFLERAPLRWCDNCRGPRKPCLCGRSDAWIEREHCRECGYALRALASGDRPGRRAA